jgi:NADPH-dependent curcumin reductase CurA
VSSQVSEYNKKDDERFGVTNLSEIFRRRITIQGFIYGDDNIFSGNIESFNENMPKWISDGSIKSKFTRFDGFENVQEAFLAIFSGKIFGKSVLKLSEP